MANSNKKIIDTLNHLIAIAEDGREGYKNAADDVKDTTMKHIFKKYVTQRTQFITQLQNQVQNLGGSPEHNGGPLGVLHRTWMDMKAVFTSGDKNAIIKACITGELTAVKIYQEAINNEIIDGNLRAILAEQLAGIDHAMREIKLQIVELAKA